MIYSVLALLSLQAPPIADYFPGVPGAKYRYTTTTSDGEVVKTVDTVKAAEDLDGVKVTPVESSVKGKVFSVQYYRLDGNSLVLVKRDQEEVSPEMVALKVGPGVEKWVWTGKDARMDMTLHFECRSKGMKEVLGSKREIVELKVDGEMKLGAAMIKFRQAATYAKGIGMVEMLEEQLGKDKRSRTVKLDSYDVPATPGG